MVKRLLYNYMAQRFERLHFHLLPSTSTMKNLIKSNSKQMSGLVLIQFKHVQSVMNSKTKQSFYATNRQRAAWPHRDVSALRRSQIQQAVLFATNVLVKPFKNILANAIQLEKGAQNAYQEEILSWPWGIQSGITIAQLKRRITYSRGFGLLKDNVISSGVSHLHLCAFLGWCT